MASLKQDERRYAMQRVNELRKALEAQVRRACTKEVKQDAKALDRIRVARITGGDYDFPRRMTTKDLDKKVRDVVTFFDMDDSVEEFNEKDFKNRMRSVRKEFAKVTDAIMLGDAADAKRLLQELEDTVEE